MYSSNDLPLELVTEAPEQIYPPFVSTGNEHELEEHLLEEHWDCFDGPPCFATYPPDQIRHHGPENDRDEDTPPLKSGETYSVLDFCCHRAPAWYRSEVNRVVQLAETKSAQDTSGSSSCNSSLLDVWESSHTDYLERKRMIATARAPTPSLIVTITTSTPKAPKRAPTRVQPSRNSKRKAGEPADSKPRVTVKRRKVTNGKGMDQCPAATYHIPKATFNHALHLSAPPTENICGKICHRSYRTFRNRLIAKVTSKMMGIYSRRAAERSKKARRCALLGRETAGPWYATGGASAGEAVTTTTGLPTAPEPDMLPSPSCANWPPLAKSRTRMAKEDVEQNVVEFEGLRFLVDVCGEPPLQRVMMI